MKFAPNLQALGSILSIHFVCCHTPFENQVNKDYLDVLPFAHAYPKHLRAKHVKSKDAIIIDGKPNEPVWDSAMWDSKFVDITTHKNKTWNDVPEDLQVAVAVLWDDNYLYVAARIKEPFIYGNITGHNIQAAYHDNDFEVFIDVSGTSQYYKEFEMNVLNATYDVNWGVPDQADLSCDGTNEREKPYLPVCTNTTFSGYPGNWTMKDVNSSPSHVDKGLQTATDFDDKLFAKYSDGKEWTLEIAFPIQRSQHHGGLLDTFGDDNSYERYHPKYINASSAIPLYWWIDFARAEHPRQYRSAINPERNDMDTTRFCPLECGASLSTYLPSLENPDALQCLFLQNRFPTLLGTNPVYGCYFEWVYQALGWRNNYMHRPQSWAILEFTDSDHSCRNIEFVGRHAVALIFLAQVQYKLHTGNYSSDLRTPTDARYCIDEQDCNDLRTILEQKNVFTKVRIKVIENAAVLTKQCTSRPCYRARLHVSVPAASHRSSQKKFDTCLRKSVITSMKINIF